MVCRVQLGRALCSTNADTSQTGKEKDTDVSCREISGQISVEKCVETLAHVTAPRRAGALLVLVLLLLCVITITSTSTGTITSIIALTARLQVVGLLQAGAADCGDDEDASGAQLHLHLRARPKDGPRSPSQDFLATPDADQKDPSIRVNATWPRQHAGGVARQQECVDQGT